MTMQMHSHANARAARETIAILQLRELSPSLLLLTATAQRAARSIPRLALHPEAAAQFLLSSKMHRHPQVFWQPVPAKARRLRHVSPLTAASLNVPHATQW